MVLKDQEMGWHIPSSKPLATPEKLHTAVQKNSHQLKISGGQAFTAATVAFTRLEFPIVSCALACKVDSKKNQEYKTYQGFLSDGVVQTIPLYLSPTKKRF